MAELQSPCSGENDAGGDSCFLPSNCAENPKNPCPQGQGCGCDNSKSSKLVAKACAACVLNEGTRNQLFITLPIWQGYQASQLVGDGPRAAELLAKHKESLRIATDMNKGGTY